MSAHGTSHIHCSNDGNKSCDDCHHFLFWDQTGGQQSSSEYSEETGVCIARDDRADLGLGCVSGLVEAAQGPSQGNVTASTLYLWLLLIYIPSWNFSFPRGNSTIVNNAKIL